MKKKLLGSILLGLSLMLGCAAPAMADSRRVVTLGQDLSEEQKDTMMRYFGVNYDSVDLLYINNQDERDHLASYVPLEQIGNYTYSCALVAPTTSGGIQVKTANLTWVTCNMIASTLSTSGVTNCQVVAAAPFKVSGTGALTGVIMAYETASKTILEPQKVELANQELVTTGNLSDEVGQSKATAIINATKTQVIENNVTNIEEINNIINNVSNEYNVSIDADQSEEIAELMQKIAEQEYDIVQLKATLDRVQANVIGDAGGSEEQILEAQEKADLSEKAALEASEDLEQLPDDEEDFGDDGIIFDDEEEVNILDNTDPDAFGSEGVDEIDTTKTVQEQETETEEADMFDDIPEATGDDIFDDEPEDPSQGTDFEEFPDETEDADITVDQPEETLSPDSLDAPDKEIYDKVKSDMSSAFAGGMVTDDFGAQVYLTEDAAKKVPEKVEEYVLKVLSKGAMEVEAEEMEDPQIDQDIMMDTELDAPDRNYDDEELQQIDKFVRRMVFKDSEKILESSQLTDDDKVVIYDQIMSVLEKAYGVEKAEDDLMADEGLDEMMDSDLDADMEEDGMESLDEFDEFDEDEGIF